MSLFKFFLSLNNLKVERGLHAASFIGLPRIRPADPDAAINAGIKRRRRECPVLSLFSFGFVDGGVKDSATRRSSNWSSAMAFCSFRRRFTRYLIDSAKPANFVNISLVLTTQYMGVEEFLRVVGSIVSWFF